MSKVKVSIRLALNDNLRDALDLIKRTRYPFLKEDEILKLALSQLYSSEHIISSKQVTVSMIIARIRNVLPNFGKEWMEKRGVSVEDMDSLLLCEMLIEFLSKNGKV